MSSYGADGPTSPAPGWYPTPSGETRYWDGHRWTDHLVPPSQPSQPSQPIQPAYAVQPYAPQPQHLVPGALPYGTVVVAPKNPGLALIASFFIPGLGQFLNGDGGKGVVFLVCYFLAWAFSLILIGIPFVIGTWIWSMVDAWSSAKNWNRARGIIS